MKEWKSFNDECPRCGNSPVDILTSAKGKYAYDGDDAECFECGLTGCVIVDEDDNGDGIARVDWNDFDED